MNIHSALTLVLVATTALLPHRARADGAPTNGLIHQWHFDETSGTTAADSVGNWSMTLYNGAKPKAPGILGSAVSLDGINDLLGTRGEGTFMASDFTFSLWEYFVPVFGKLGLFQFLTDNQASVIVDLGSGHPSPVLSVNQYQATSPSNTLIDDNQWHLITLVKTTNQAVMYLDENKVATTPAPSINNLQAFILQLGQVDTTHFFSGLIDEVSIYNRALSLAEIAQAAAVPEPSAALFFMGALGAFLPCRRRTRRSCGARRE